MFADLLSSYEVSNQISGIEDLIAQGATLPTVIRLLCLATIVNGGIKTKTLEGIKREILQVPLAFHFFPPYTIAYRFYMLLDIWLRKSTTASLAFV